MIQGWIFFEEWGDDVIQKTLRALLEVIVGPVTILRAKRFKEAFNKLLQDTWAKIDFKKILNNEEYVLINLIHVKEELVGDIQLQKNWNENTKTNNKSTINWREENFSDKR
jgi:hypothetical protein